MLAHLAHPTRYSELHFEFELVKARLSMTSKKAKPQAQSAPTDSLAPTAPSGYVKLTDLIEGAVSYSRNFGITGWIWDRSKPYQALAVELLANTEVIASSVANVFNVDLAERNIGNGKHAFRLRAQSWPDLALPIELLIRVAGTPLVLGKLTVRTHADIAGLAISAPTGHVDGIVSGTIKGWAVDRANPELTVALDVIANGTVLQTVACSEYRKDLHSAGYADGRCGFSLELPISLLDGNLHSLSICYSGTQRALPNGTFMYGLTKESELTKYISSLVRVVKQSQSELAAVEQRLLMRHEALMTIQRENMERELQVLRRLLTADSAQLPTKTSEERTASGPKKLATPRKAPRAKR